MKITATARLSIRNEWFSALTRDVENEKEVTEFCDMIKETLLEKINENARPNIVTKSVNDYTLEKDPPTWFDHAKNFLGKELEDFPEYNSNLKTNHNIVTTIIKNTQDKKREALIAHFRTLSDINKRRSFIPVLTEFQNGPLFIGFVTYIHYND